MTAARPVGAGADGSAGPAPRAGVDRRLVPGALGAWAGAGVAVGLPPGPMLVGSVVALALGLVLARTRPLVGAPRPPDPSSRRLRVPALGRLGGVLLLVCAALAAADAGLRVAALERGPVAGLAARGAGVRIELVVTSDPHVARSRPSASTAAGDLVVVPARIVLLHRPEGGVRVASPVLVLASDSRWTAVRLGERVSTVGTLRPGRRGEGTAAVVFVRGPPHLLAAAGPVDRAAAAARAGLRRASAGLGRDERGLLPGLVDGDTAEVPPDLADDFRTTGLTHLLAVSGANLAIVLAFVLWGARWCGVRGRWLPGCGLVTLAAFVVVARPEPSVLRAAAMGLVTLVALGSGRRGSGLSALSAAVVGLVLLDPWLARSFGFVLSVLATGALLLLAGPWSDALVRRGVPRPLAVALAAPTAAQLACAPVVVLFSGQVSLVAVPANLLAAPAVAPATVLGVVALSVSALSPAAAAVVAHIAGLPVWWIAWVARTGAAAPHAAMGWSASYVGALVLALLTVGGLLGLPPFARLAVRRLGRPVALGCAALLVVVVPVSGRIAGPRWPPPGWVLVACDVGQGDALVLAAGPGAAAVVDTGPEPDLIDGCLHRLGVRQVPILVLTHLHADHAGGLAGALHGRRVGVVEVGPLAEPVDQWRQVVAQSRARGVPLVPVVMGEQVTVGPLTWQVLWPARVIRGEGSDPNNASIVLLVRTRGLRLLLTGDVETAAQRALLAALPDGQLPGGPVDLLKVAHHGSAAQAPELVAAAAPRAAVISVGRDNDYGHPALRTLALLRDAGVPTWRTDQAGDVAVVATDGGRLRLVGRGR